jgi:hypothetical protein
VNQSLLLCFAHPDDESFFAAVIVCKYRAANGSVLSTETFRLGFGVPLRRLPADDRFADLTKAK